MFSELQFCNECPVNQLRLRASNLPDITLVESCSDNIDDVKNHKDGLLTDETYDDEMVVDALEGTVTVANRAIEVDITNLGRDAKPSTLKALRKCASMMVSGECTNSSPLRTT